MMSLIIDELVEQYAGQITFTKIDFDKNRKMASTYGIMSIPFLLIFKGGKSVSQITGFFLKEALKRKIEEVLQK